MLVAEIDLSETVVALTDATVDKSPSESAGAGFDMFLYEEDVRVIVLNFFEPAGTVTDIGIATLIGEAGVDATILVTAGTFSEFGL